MATGLVCQIIMRRHWRHFVARRSSFHVDTHCLTYCPSERTTVDAVRCAPSPVHWKARLCLPLVVTTGVVREGLRPRRCRCRSRLFTSHRRTLRSVHTCSWLWHRSLDPTMARTRRHHHARKYQNMLTRSLLRSTKRVIGRPFFFLTSALVWRCTRLRAETV